MKTVIELAKQAGWEYADDDRGFEPLWRFAELVRADERERIYFQTSSDFVKAAIAEEREACAKVCEEYETNNDITATWLNIVAEAIRARSNT